ncbi:MAG TPA: hypothetical protein VFI03_00470 [Solirubrobacterales bacterium]|nr:hypothetical protein [Solirubrobacterales bacterium]
MAESEPRQAFVVMPFDPEFQTVYDMLIAPALEKVGYAVKRADSDLDQQNVLKDVVRGIANADLVVAELTSRNPNVLYELGVSHALRRNTVLITQSMDDIPFDLRTYRVIRYSTLFDAASRLGDQLEAIGKAHLEGNIDFGSPVVDFLPEQSPGTQEVAEQKRSGVTAADVSADTESETNSDEGFLDAILSLQSADGQLKERLTAIADSTERVGEQFAAKTQEVNDIQAAGGPGMAATAHRVAGELGKVLDVYAAELNVEAPGLESESEQLINAGLTFTAWLADQDEIDIAQAVSNRDSLAELGAATREGLKAIGGFRDLLIQLSGISRDMARGTGRAITALDCIIGALEQVEAFTEKSVDLLDERIPHNKPTLDEDESATQDEEEAA